MTYPGARQTSLPHAPGPGPFGPGPRWDSMFLRFCQLCIVLQHVIYFLLKDSDLNWVATAPTELPTRQNSIHSDLSPMGEVPGQYGANTE